MFASTRTNICYDYKDDTNRNTNYLIAVIDSLLMLASFKENIAVSLKDKRNEITHYIKGDSL